MFFLTITITTLMIWYELFQRNRKCRSPSDGLLWAESQKREQERTNHKTLLVSNLASLTNGKIFKRDCKIPQAFNDFSDSNNLSNASLPPFSLIRDFRKQNTRGNVSKISVNRTLSTDRIEIHQSQPASGVTRHGTMPRRLVQKYYLLVPVFCFPVSWVFRFRMQKFSELKCLL